VHVRSKLNLTTLSIISIAMLILVISTTYIIKNYSIEPKKDLVKQSAEEIAANYKRLFSEIAGTMHYIENLTTLQYVVAVANQGVYDADYQESMYALYKNFIAINAANEYILDSYLCDLSGKVLVSTKMMAMEKDFVLKKLLPTLQQDGKISLFREEVEGRDSFWLGLAVTNNLGEVVGYLVDDISVDFFSHMMINTTKTTTGLLFIVDTAGNPMMKSADIDTDTLQQSLATPQILKILDGMPQSMEALEGNLDYEAAGRDFTGYYVIMPDYDWLLVSAMPKFAMNSVQQDIIFAAIGILAIMIVIAFLFVGLLSKTITKPLKVLTEVVEEVSAGNFDIRCEDMHKKDEFGQLAKGFNQMLDELAQSRQSLEDSERRYRMAIEGVNDMIWEYDVATRNIFVSDKWKQLFGYNINGPFRRSSIIKHYLHPQDIGAFLDFTTYDAHNTKAVMQAQEFRMRKQNGEYVWLMAKGNIYTDDIHHIVRIVGSVADISERKHQEEKIKQLAYYDQTTGLLNHIRFGELMEEEIKKNPLKQKALLFINLNRFRHINEAFGYNYGNYILRQLANVIKTTVIRGQVARLSGDQFAVLVPDCAKRDNAFVLAEKIVSGISEATRQDGTVVELTSSVGIAFYPDQGSGLDELMKNAGIALLCSKKDQKANRIEVFSLSMLSNIQNNNAIFAVLRNALDTGELQLYFQPQYNLQSGKICSLEALARLFSKEIGYISPGEFISLAEERDFILPMGDWILKQTFQTAVALQEAGMEFDKLAVNISLLQLLDAGFIGRVKELLRQTGADPKKIEFEITESILLKSFDYGINQLKGLRQMDINVALDDFGTGYSSLSYLSTLPINTLKIDQSFVGSLETQEKTRYVVKTVINMAHQLDMKVVCEGVETEGQLNLLHSYGCDVIQGFYFSPALPLKEAAALLQICHDNQL